MQFKFPLVAAIALTTTLSGFATPTQAAAPSQAQPIPAASTTVGTLYTYECVAETPAQIVDCASTFYVGEQEMPVGTLGELITEHGLPSQDIGFPEVDADTFGGKFSTCLLLAQLIVMLDMQVDDLNEAIAAYEDLGLEDLAAAAQQLHNDAADSRDALQRAYDRECK